ncbi:hypothetical protein CYMTET_48774 [Cymbomonas tetramitiformis]|uniref:Uncharacterized protein n=1 Tax=Cymbomonas tetramitiformis TaxID=36881 RepID=A0AAE0BRN8_9CHLO|nr:hypothetical protein CYMTET_48774 [Cymbomonas tetramitiformis]
MYRPSKTKNGALAVTAKGKTEEDASGWQGGIALRDWRHIVDFPVEERAPHKSSNFREASTAAAAVELLGPSHRGERLLLRTDNTTTMSMVNKQGTMAPDLWPVCKRMFDSAALYDLDLAAEHIPGVENWLSDGLSRYVRRKDCSDWQYRRDEFESIADTMAMPFTLDGGADPVGTNAHLPRYRSVVDGFTRSPVDGEHVYSNPDYACVREYLEHFLACQRRSPFGTAGTFVLPVWDTYDWWPLLKGAHVLRVYPTGSDLFTSPEWRNLAAGDGTYAFGAERAFRGSTHWPGAALGSKTVGNYRPKARAFMTFCEAEGREWLPATEATVRLYIAQMLDKGTVQASNTQPYLSAINNYHEDMGLPGPAKGRAVSRAVKGMSRLQVQAADAAGEEQPVRTWDHGGRGFKPLAL